MSTNNQPATGAFLSENGRMIAGPPDAASLVEPRACQEKASRRQAQSYDALEHQKGRATATGVIAGRVQGGEAGLQILRQRRSRTVLQEETRRPLPRLLQEALRFGRTGQEGHARSEGEGREVVKGG